MSGIHHSRQLLTVLAASLLALTDSGAEAVSRLSTRFLARGEQALLEVAVADVQPAEWPEIPVVAGVEIRQAGRVPRLQPLPGRKREYVLEYLVSSYAAGGHTIPAITVLADGVKSHTEPLDFTVFNPDELQWSETLAGDTKIRYASAFRVMTPHPYEGETTPIEIKIFVPRDLFVEDWGIPDARRDGVTSWRFQPSAMRGQINLLGLPYVAVAYPSTLTPTRTGQIGIGPATIRLMTTQVVMDGILKRIPQELNLTVAPLQLDAIPLPKGAPAGFENAIGSFQVDVSTASPDAQEGDPIPVDIVVTGSGNLDTLHPPKPIDATGWKIYEATPEARGDERRQLTGRTVFHQFLRPLEIKPAVPAFRLVYFDPKAAAYKSLITEPIPLRMTPGLTPKPDVTTPPAALPAPLERMTDILGVLRTAPLTGSGAPRWHGGWIHLLCGLAALGLIAKALWLRHGHRLRQDPDRDARRQELREIQQLSLNDDAGFLMLAGRFIERRLGQHLSPEIQAVLAERDAWCFRQDKSPGPILDPKRRKAILNLLRKTALLWLLAAMVNTGTGRPADWKTAVSAVSANGRPACWGTGNPAHDRRDACLPSQPGRLCSANLPDRLMSTIPARLAAGLGQTGHAGDLAGQALEAYDCAKYDTAISLWLHAGAYDELTADTLYNIGNACYRAGSPGYAALYYRRALARVPGHPESRQNLRFIERKCGAITVHRPDYQYALTRWPLAAWQGLLWAGIWMIVLAALVIPATRPGARVRVVAAAALILGPMCLAIGGLGWRFFPNDAEFSPLGRQAVIIGEHAILHADAARTSPEVIDAPPGSLCEVIEESGRWAYVAFASQTRGWLPVEWLEKVVPTRAPVAPTLRKPKADGKSA
ncbi:MAG: tetratricopeptide repeat protein [Verrucomicrobiota bacterium]